MRTLRTLVAFMALALSGAANAANAVNIAIDSTTNDSIGRQLATNLREKVNSSSLLSLVYGDSVSSLKVHFVTLNPDEGATQNYTVYSFVLVAHFTNDGLDRYLTSSVGTCGLSKIDACASDIKATIDEWADALRNVAAKK